MSGRTEGEESFQPTPMNNGLHFCGPWSCLQVRNPKFVVLLLVSLRKQKKNPKTCHPNPRIPQDLLCFWFPPRPETKNPKDMSPKPTDPTAALLLVSPQAQNQKTQRHVTQTHGSHGTCSASGFPPGPKPKNPKTCHPNPRIPRHLLCFWFPPRPKSKKLKDMSHMDPTALALLLVSPQAQNQKPQRHVTQTHGSHGTCSASGFPPSPKPKNPKTCHPNPRIPRHLLCFWFPPRPKTKKLKDMSPKHMDPTALALLLVSPQTQNQKNQRHVTQTHGSLGTCSASGFPHGTCSASEFPPNPKPKNPKTCHPNPRIPRHLLCFWFPPRPKTKKLKDMPPKHMDPTALALLLVSPQAQNQKTQRHVTQTHGSHGTCSASGFPRHPNPRIPRHLLCFWIPPKPKTKKPKDMSPKATDLLCFWFLPSPKTKTPRGMSPKPTDPTAFALLLVSPQAQNQNTQRHVTQTHGSHGTCSASGFPPGPNPKNKDMSPKPTAPMERTGRLGRPGGCRAAVQPPEPPPFCTVPGVGSGRRLGAGSCAEETSPARHV